jgi:regulatory protein
VARAIVLRKLTAAPATRSQLSTLLARRGVPDDVAVAVLDRFEEVGLVDDAEYAAMFVRSRQQGRGLAKRALAHELRAKGVDDEVVREALTEVDPDDEYAAALVLVRKRWPSVAGLEREARMRRLLGMLARKGYPAGVSAAAISEVSGEALALAEQSE